MDVVFVATVNVSYAEFTSMGPVKYLRKIFQTGKPIERQ